MLSGGMNIVFLVFLFGLSPLIIFMLYRMNMKNAAFNQKLSRIVEAAPSSIEQLKANMSENGIPLNFDNAYSWVVFCAFKKDLLVSKDATSDMIVNQLMLNYLKKEEVNEDMTEYDFNYLLFCMIKIWSYSGLPLTEEMIKDYVSRWGSRSSHSSLNPELLSNWLHNEIDFFSNSKEYKGRLTTALTQIELLELN